MAAHIKPIAKVVYVCDDVVRDPESGKVSLLNLWDTVRVPTDGEFPYCLAKLSVFAWWRDGLGNMRTRIDIVQAETAKVIRRTKDCMIDFRARPASVFARYKLENCLFPAPGYYYVELYCENEFGDDQIISLLPPEE
jgi:hypothetical protein